MLIEKFINPQIFRAPDGEGAGAGSGVAAGGDGAPAGAPDDTGGQAPDAGTGAPDTGLQRPAWMPEKLWGDGSQFANDGTLNTDAMAESLADAYKNAERSLFKRKDDLRKEIEQEVAEHRAEGLPQAPGDYEIKPLDLPENIEFEFADDDPLVQAAREMAYKYKMPQTEFNHLVDSFVRSQLAIMPNFDEEMKVLGDYGEQRLERVNRWIGKNMSEESRGTIENMAVRADFVKALEEIMELSGEPKFEMQDSGDFKESLTRADLEVMMRDPRYSGKQTEIDPAYVAKVRAGFRTLARREAGGR